MFFFQEIPGIFVAQNCKNSGNFKEKTMCPKRCPYDIGLHATYHISYWYIIWSAMRRRPANFWFGTKKGKKTQLMKLPPHSLKQLKVVMRLSEAGRNQRSDETRRRDTDLRKMTKRMTGRHPRRHRTVKRRKSHPHLGLSPPCHPLQVKALSLILPNLLPKARRQRRLEKRCFFSVNLYVLWFPLWLRPKYN